MMKTRINPKDIADRLKQVIAEANISQLRFATLIGKSESTVSGYLNGTIKVPTQVLCDAADIAGDVTLDWLIAGKKTEEDDHPREKEGERKRVGIVEEWLGEVLTNNPTAYTHAMMAVLDSVPEFKEWYDEKKGRTASGMDGHPRQKIG